MLLAVTNRPIWADTTLLGLAFLISAASTSAALLIMLGSWGGVSGESLAALERFDASVLALEFVAIVVLVASLGRVAMVWLNGWGVGLAVMLLGGVVLPLFLRSRPPTRGSIGPVLVLLGGLIFRTLIIFSSDQL